MRCPKCGFISFDQQVSCKKCSTDLTAAADALAGTGLRVEEPFFLASVLGSGEREEEFDLGEMAGEREVAIDLDEQPGEEVPRVDLSAFGQESAPAGVEESRVTLPDDEEGGTIEFSMGEEPAGAAVSVNDLLLEDEQPDLELAGREEGAEEKGGIEFSLPGDEAPSHDELQLEMDEEGSSEFAQESMPEIELEEGEAAGEQSAASGGLNLDLDLDLDDDAGDEEMVFNLEDIDMGDLLISEESESGQGRPEDTSGDLEGFLQDGQEGSKKDGELPDIEL